LYMTLEPRFSMCEDRVLISRRPLSNERKYKDRSTRHA